MRFIAPAIFAFMLLASSQQAHSTTCPTRASLTDGIVFSQPAKDLSVKNGVQYFDKRYRLLKGPYLGSTYVDRRLNTSKRVSFAGLFLHKAWRNGKLTQFEEPKTDMSGLLWFEPGTTHAYHTLRVNPANPRMTWRTKGMMRVDDAGHFTKSGCRYRMVRLTFEGTVTRQDGSSRAASSSFLFLPDLLLRTSGHTTVYRQTINKLRKRTAREGADWPFSKDAGRILE